MVVDWYRLVHFQCFCTSLLLLKEILHYLTCMKPSRWWDIWYLPYQLVSQMFAIKSSTKLDYIDSHNISYPIYFLKTWRWCSLSPCWNCVGSLHVGVPWDAGSTEPTAMARSFASAGVEVGVRILLKVSNKISEQIPPPPKTNMTIPDPLETPQMNEDGQFFLLKMGIFQWSSC